MYTGDEFPSISSIIHPSEAPIRLTSMSNSLQNSTQHSQSTPGNSSSSEGDHSETTSALSCDDPELVEYHHSPATSSPIGSTPLSIPLDQSSSQLSSFNLHLHIDT